MPYVVPTGTSSLVLTFPLTDTFTNAPVISGSVLKIVPNVYTSYLLGIKSVLVVIEPEIKLLVPPKSDVISTEEPIASQCVPFHPKIDNDDNVVMTLLASHVKVILVGVAPLISQYSTSSTEPTPTPLRAVLNGPLAGNIGSFPPLSLEVIAVVALTL